ncbi:MAG: hypothetical protein CMJ88_01840 [Planctomycetes bacterium]|nr:hypothetical protein [Planctomycetota bacterium]
MRLYLFIAAFAAFSFSDHAAAQDNAPARGDVQVYNFDGPRHASNMVLFGTNLAAGITIVHGQPNWKDEYTGMLDMLKGKTHRLGKDLWTTLMTSATIELGGVKIAAGCYCVGLRCDKDGNFALAMIGATKAMKKGLMPFGPQEWQPTVLAPVKLEKNVSKKVAKKMVISLVADAERKDRGSLSIAWGPHRLTAPLKINIPNR